MLHDALSRLLVDLATPERVRGAEAGQADAAALWQPIADAGFLDVCLPENHGGPALEPAELFALLTLPGRFALPLPLVPTMLGRGLLAGQAELPQGPLALAMLFEHPPQGGLRCAMTPWGGSAGWVLAADGDDALLLSTEDTHKEVVGDPRDALVTLLWPEPRPLARLAGQGDVLRGMALRGMAALMCGAMQRALELTLRHCNDRQQFGRPLSKFQAVQQQISTMAEQVVAAGIATEAAFHAAAGAQAMLAAAVAKSRASEAAARVAASAHALHGAMGMTLEYELNLLTRRQHAWRMACGAEQHWNAWIGARLLADGCSAADFVRRL